MKPVSNYTGRLLLEAFSASKIGGNYWSLLFDRIVQRRYIKRRAI